MLLRKQLKAVNAQGYVLFRFIGTTMYIQGKLGGNALNVINSMKAKNYIKSTEQMETWVKVIFIEDVTEHHIETQLIPTMLNGYKTAKYQVTMEDI